jgi:uncharacterized protein (DUF1684 family)
MNNAYLSTLSAWRTQMETSLRREYGWLTLAGLFWLQQGDNPFGSGEHNLIRLPARAPAEAGVISLSGSLVTVTPAAGVQLRLNDAPLQASGQALKPDLSGDPDFLFIDDIRLGLIQRSGELAIRIWDPQHPARLGSVGRRWFAPNEAAIVTAQIQAYDPPKSVVVEDVLGMQQQGEMHAALRFKLNGQSFSLEAERLEDDSYYILFRDATAGESSYPAGRYLYTEVAEGQQVIIDFNKAYSPPCAFTDFATCPLPQPENILPLRIEAGEKYEPAH